jgi:hypothetical protein
MEDILSSPITWIVIAALSEIIGLSPLKDNSVIQLVIKARIDATRWQDCIYYKHAFTFR